MSALSVAPVVLPSVRIGMPAAQVPAGSPMKRIGAHGVPVIFVHPKNTDGVLVELMAEPTEHHA